MLMRRKHVQSQRRKRTECACSDWHPCAKWRTKNCVDLSRLHSHRKRKDEQRLNGGGGRAWRHQRARLRMHACTSVRARDGAGSCDHGSPVLLHHHRASGTHYKIRPNGWVVSGAEEAKGKSLRAATSSGLRAHQYQTPTRPEHRHSPDLKRVNHSAVMNESGTIVGSI